jgi:hypothetical protein
MVSWSEEKREGAAGSKHKTQTFCSATTTVGLESSVVPELGRTFDGRFFLGRVARCLCFLFVLALFLGVRRPTLLDAVFVVLKVSKCCWTFFFFFFFFFNFIGRPFLWASETRAETYRGPSSSRADSVSCTLVPLSAGAWAFAAGEIGLAFARIVGSVGDFNVAGAPVGINRPTDVGDRRPKEAVRSFGGAWMRARVGRPPFFFWRRRQGSLGTILAILAVGFAVWFGCTAECWTLSVWQALRLAWTRLRTFLRRCLWWLTGRGICGDRGGDVQTYCRLR